MQSRRAADVNVEDTSVAELRRAELEGMGVMALHKLAVSGGVDVMSDLKDAMGESEIR